jgi:hypothetical protein
MSFDRPMTREEFIDAAFAELRRIESGQATVHLIEGDVLIGKVRYQTSEGWTIVVFSVGDAWDYIDSITAPNSVHGTTRFISSRNCSRWVGLRYYSNVTSVNVCCSMG